MNTKTLMKIIGNYDSRAERLNDEERRTMKARESTQLTEELEKVRAYFQDRGGIKVVNMNYIEAYHYENATVVLLSRYVSAAEYAPHLGEFRFWVSITSRDSIDSLVQDLQEKLGMEEKQYASEWEKKPND